MELKKKKPIEFVLKAMCEQAAKMDPEKIDEIWVVRQIEKMFRENMEMTTKDFIEMTEEALRQIEQEEKENGGESWIKKHSRTE